MAAAAVTSAMLLRAGTVALTMVDKKTNYDVIMMMFLQRFFL
jgi:hypothetical protein